MISENLDDALGFESERDYNGSAPNPLWQNISQPAPENLGGLRWRARIIRPESSLEVNEFLSYRLYISMTGELYVRKVAEYGTFWARVPRSARTLVLNTFMGERVE